MIKISFKDEKSQTANSFVFNIKDKQLLVTITVEQKANQDKLLSSSELFTAHHILFHMIDFLQKISVTHLSGQVKTAKGQS